MGHLMLHLEYVYTVLMLRNRPQEDHEVRGRAEQACGRIQKEFTGRVPPYTRVMLRSAISLPRARAACVNTSSLPLLDPQNTHTLFKAHAPLPPSLLPVIAPLGTTLALCLRRLGAPVAESRIKLEVNSPLQLTVLIRL